MLQVGKASSWRTGSVASPLSRAAYPSRGHTAYAYLESTLLELSSVAKKVCRHTPKDCQEHNSVNLHINWQVT